MPTRWQRCLEKCGLSQDKLRGSRVHRFLGEKMFHSVYWAFERDALAKAWLVGFFMACTPFIGLHMILAGLVAFVVRANIPVSMALAWLTNPLTMLFYYPLAYRLGCWVLNQPVASTFNWRAMFENGWGNFVTGLIEIGDALFLGCTLIGIVGGIAGYLLIRFFSKRIH